MTAKEWADWLDGITPMALYEAGHGELRQLITDLAECEAAVRSHGYKRDIALERAEKAEAATEDWRLRLTEALRESEAERDALRANDDAIRAEYGWKRDGRELPECIRERLAEDRRALVLLAQNVRALKVGDEIPVTLLQQADAALAKVEEGK